MLSVVSMSCVSDIDQTSLMTADRSSALLVPDTNLELYVYAKQERLTSVPAEIANLSRDVLVDTMAIWGLPSEHGMIFGAGLTFANAEDASRIYSEIKLEENIWKTLQGNKIYVVKGSGNEAESLKSAITNNNFKYYTDGTVLESVSILPRGGSTNLIAIALAKPTKQVMEFAEANIPQEAYLQIERITKLLNADVIIGGLYSPHQINIAKAVESFQSGSNISSLEAGALILIKSGLPGFVISPVIRSVLVDYDFQEITLSDSVMYKKIVAIDDENEIPILVRVEGNYIFIAASWKEAYAQLLLTSIYK